MLPGFDARCRSVFVSVSLRLTRAKYRHLLNMAETCVPLYLWNFHPVLGVQVEPMQCKYLCCHSGFPYSQQKETRASGT